MHSVTHRPNLRHVGEPLGGAESLLETVSFKKMTMCPNVSVIFVYMMQVSQKMLTKHTGSEIFTKLITFRTQSWWFWLSECCSDRYVESERINCCAETPKITPRELEELSLLDKALARAQRAWSLYQDKVSGTV